MADFTQQQVHQMWLTAAEKVKDRVIAPTLYRAVELGVGLTIEDGFFVLGFSNADMPMAGHLRSSGHLAIVEQSISEVTKQKLRLRIVEGTSLKDYENFKKLQATRDASATTMSERRAAERAVELEWEQVAEAVTRGYAKLQGRQFAQSRGQFIRWCFGVINEAVNKFNYTEQSDEIHKRSLARVFEKLATCVEVPSAILAYEFLRLREEDKLH
ncbi:MAG: hypothetical protein M1133_04895 [Armatimonadetes bacterium]|nr:hypothetical protein [Armatimonadota bacterium]